MFMLNETGFQNLLNETRPWKSVQELQHIETFPKRSRIVAMHQDGTICNFEADLHPRADFRWNTYRTFADGSTAVPAGARVWYFIRYTADARDFAE